MLYTVERLSVDHQSFKSRLIGLETLLRSTQQQLRPIPTLVVGEPCDTYEELGDLERRISELDERDSLVCTYIA
jgi:hypothetical protein